MAIFAEGEEKRKTSPARPEDGSGPTERVPRVKITAKFPEFDQLATKNGNDSSIKEMFGLRGHAELEQLWRADFNTYMDVQTIQLASLSNSIKAGSCRTDLAYKKERNSSEVVTGVATRGDSRLFS